MGGLFIGVGILIWLGGMVVGLFEVAYWLKKGYWTSNTLALVFGSFTPQDWSGFTQILFWLWQQPLWAVAACAGLALLVIGAISESRS